MYRSSGRRLGRRTRIPTRSVWASRVRRQLAAAVKRSSAIADRIVPPPTGIVVLIYHRVEGGSGTAVDLPAALFDEQLAWLGDHATVVTLDDAVELLLGRRPLPVRPVVITFDDGTRDFTEHAVPALVRHRLPATLYVATEFPETGREFPDDGVPVDWAALRDAVATGFVGIGSHTHSHALLDRSAPAEVDAELDRSIDLIGERLGVEARHFAYPKAVLGTPVAEHAIRRRFETAAVAGTRPNAPLATDLHRLNRTPIQVGDGMEWFVRKALGGMRLEDSLRRTLNRHRYRNKAY